MENKNAPSGTWWQRLYAAKGVARSKSTTYWYVYVVLGLIAWVSYKRNNYSTAIIFFLIACIAHLALNIKYWSSTAAAYKDPNVMKRNQKVRVSYKDGQLVCPVCWHVYDSNWRTCIYDNSSLIKRAPDGNK